MNKPFSVLAVLFVPLLGACPASAQTVVSAPPAADTPSVATDVDLPSAPSKGEQQALLLFKLLDVNGDGALSKEEVQSFSRLRDAFDAADTNHDGKITLDEIRAFTIKYRAQRGLQNR